MRKIKTIFLILIILFFFISCTSTVNSNNGNETNNNNVDQTNDNESGEQQTKAKIAFVNNTNKDDKSIYYKEYVTNLDFKPENPQSVWKKIVPKTKIKVGDKYEKSASIKTGKFYLIHRWQMGLISICYCSEKPIMIKEDEIITVNVSPMDPWISGTTIGELKADKTVKLKSSITGAHEITMKKIAWHDPPSQVNNKNAPKPNLIIKSTKNTDDNKIKYKEYLVKADENPEAENSYWHLISEEKEVKPNEDYNNKIKIKSGKYYFVHRWQMGLISVCHVSAKPILIKNNALVTIDVSPMNPWISGTTLGDLSKDKKINIKTPKGNSEIVMKKISMHDF